MTLIHFRETCPAAFSFLVHEYGFQEPTVERTGAEVAVDYERGLHTVHIVMEGSLPPIVELRFPVGDSGEAAVPYVSRGAVARAQVVHVLRRAERFEPWPRNEKQYLEALARDFMEAHGWRLALPGG